MKPQSIEELRSVNDMLSLKGKVALVTGAAGGIGRSTAAAFAERGAKVALMDIPAREDMLRQNVADIKELYGGEAMYVTGDVSVPESCEAFIQKVVDTYGTIHIVHNNAGRGGSPTPDLDVDYSLWKHILDVNLNGVFLIARAAARIMVRDGHGGSIINTASINAHVINQAPLGQTFDNSAYAVSKACVLHFTKHFASQVIQYGIRVNALSPGYVVSDLYTDMSKEVIELFAKTTPANRNGRVEEMQGAVLYLASDASTYCVGTEIIADGGHVCY
jgi:sorbose reductase